MANLYTIELNGVSEDVYNKAADFIQAHALRLNYRPEVSTIDCEFPEDLDPDKATRIKRGCDPQGSSAALIPFKVFMIKTT